MKNISNKNMFFILLIISLFVMFGMIQNPQQKNDWLAPKSADTLKNPLVNNYNATMQGKILFEKKCVSCHGDKGKGDGVAGIALNPHPHDLTSAMVQKQTDGALFWKITYGKSPMATYQVILTNDQRWHLVNYMRQLGKQ